MQCHLHLHFYFTCILDNEYLTYKSMSVWELLFGNLCSYYSFSMGINIKSQRSLIFSTICSCSQITVRGENDMTQAAESITTAC